eukprot:gene7578-5343_t
MVNLLYLSFFVVCQFYHFHADQPFGTIVCEAPCHFFVSLQFLGLLFPSWLSLTGGNARSYVWDEIRPFSMSAHGRLLVFFYFYLRSLFVFSLFCRRMRRCSPCWMRGDDQLELRDREGSRFLVRIRLSHPLQLNSPHAFTDTQYIVTYFSVYPMPHKAAIAVYLAFVLPFVQAVQVCNPLSVSHLTHEQPTTTTITNTTQFNLKDQHIAIPSEARSTFPASVQTHKMEFRLLLGHAGVRQGRAIPTGASTPTAKTMSKASLLPGGAHGTAPCTPPPMSGKRRNSSVNSSAVPLERSNSTAGRAFQRTNSTMGRQKGETIRQNNRVNVYVRVRAFAEKERTGKAAELAVQMKDDTVDVTVPEKGQFSFTFDGCFWSNDRESPNHRRPDEGLVPRVCNMIFARAANSAQKGVHYTVKASMLEVYLDDVFDLLNHRKQLTVRNDFKNHTFAVVGSKNVTVTSYKDVLELLTKAEPLRTFAETKIHDHSSRAHTLFTLEVHTEYDEPEMKPRCARILIADLAGSERIRLAGTEDGLGFEQARNINLSLLALGSCIEAFRNSTLTKLLKDFLGGNSVSVMMVTIAPSAKDSNLSVQTLRFADRAKQITTHAKMNVIQEEEVVEGSVDYKRREDYAVKKEALYAEFQLEQTIEQLLNRIVDLEVKRNTCTDPDMQQHLDAELAEVEKALADAEYQLTCQRQILYGPVLQLEDAVCELQTTIQKQRADHEEELERLQSEQEQRLLEMKASHKAKQTQVEAAAAEERERQRQRLAAAKDEVEGLKSLIAQLQNENRLLQKKYEDLANSSAAKERELNDNLAALRRLLDETTAVKNEETEQLTRQGLTGFSNETVAYMQRLQESLGMSEAEMQENLARFNLLRSVLCKIDQEVKVAVQDDAKPVERRSGLRSVAPNVVPSKMAWNAASCSRSIECYFFLFVYLLCVSLFALVTSLQLSCAAPCRWNGSIPMALDFTMMIMSTLFCLRASGLISPNRVQICVCILVARLLYQQTTWSGSLLRLDHGHYGILFFIISIFIFFIFYCFDSFFSVSFCYIGGLTLRLTLCREKGCGRRRSSGAGLSDRSTECPTASFLWNPRESSLLSGYIFMLLFVSSNCPFFCVCDWIKYPFRLLPPLHLFVLLLCVFIRCSFHFQEEVPWRVAALVVSSSWTPVRHLLAGPAGTDAPLHVSRRRRHTSEKDSCPPTPHSPPSRPPTRPGRKFTIFTFSGGRKDTTVFDSSNQAHCPPHSAVHTSQRQPQPQQRLQRFAQQSRKGPKIEPSQADTNRGSSAKAEAPAAASPLRSFIAAQQQRRRQGQDEEAGTVATPRGLGRPSSSSSSSPSTSSALPVEKRSVYEHPCMLQGGCRHGGEGRCPYASHPVECCLHSVAHGDSAPCPKALAGCCPWHHGPAAGAGRRLLHALYSDEHGELEAAGLRRDAESAASALAVVVDVALVATEAAEDRQSQLDWAGLLQAVEDYATTDDGAGIVYCRAVKMDEGNDELSHSHSGGLLVVEKALLQASDELTGPATAAEEWLHGPVSSSFFVHIPATSRTPVDGVALSPLLHRWLLQHLQAARRGDSPAEEPAATVRWKRRLIASAARAVLQGRLEACRAALKQKIEGKRLGTHHSGSDVGLCLLRDAVAWSHLGIPDADDPSTTSASPAAVVLVSSACGGGGRQATDTQPLPEAKAAAMEMDPAMAALSGICGGSTDSGAAGDDVGALLREVVSDVEAARLLDHRDAAGSTAVRSVWSEFVREVCEASPTPPPAMATRVKVTQQVETRWQRVHEILLQVYSAILRPCCDPPVRRGNGECWPQSPGCTAAARAAFVAQPALLFLCRQESHTMAAAHYQPLLAAHGWERWSDAQMFASGDQQVLYSPLGFARHHLSWLGFACRHSLLNALLLTTLHYSETIFGLSQRSAVEDHGVIPSPAGPGSDFHHQLAGDEAHMAPAPLAYRWRYSQRERTQHLAAFTQVVNGFLSALQTLGEDLKVARQHCTAQFASRLAAFEQQEAGQQRSRRRYREKEYEAFRAMQRLERDAASMPVLDRLVPHGVAVVPAVTTARLLRHLLEGGAAYHGLRLAAGIVQTMRTLRRAARQPLPELQETTRLVHRRVASRKDPFKKRIVAVRMKRGDGIDAAGLTPATPPPDASAALQLIFGLDEGVVEEAVRLGLRMGDAGQRLVEGLLRETISGAVVDFLQPQGRALPTLSLQTIEACCGWPLVSREGEGGGWAGDRVVPQLLNLLGQTPSGAPILLEGESSAVATALTHSIALGPVVTKPGAGVAAAPQQQLAIVPLVYACMAHDVRHFLLPSPAVCVALQAAHTELGHFRQTLEGLVLLIEHYSQQGQGLGADAVAGPTPGRGLEKAGTPSMYLEGGQSDLAVGVAAALRLDVHHLQRLQSGELYHGLHEAFYRSATHRRPGGEAAGANSGEVETKASALEAAKTFLRRAAAPNEPASSQQSSSSSSNGGTAAGPGAAAPPPATALYPLMLLDAAGLAAPSRRRSTERSGPRSSVLRRSTLHALCAGAALRLTSERATRSRVAAAVSPLLWKWTLLTAVTPQQRGQRSALDHCCRLLLLSELLRTEPLPGRQGQGQSLSFGAGPSGFLLSTSITPRLPHLPQWVWLQVMLWRRLRQEEEGSGAVLDIACAAFIARRTAGGSRLATEEHIQHSSSSSNQSVKKLRRRLEQLLCAWEKELLEGATVVAHTPHRAPSSNTAGAGASEAMAMEEVWSEATALWRLTFDSFFTVTPPPFTASVSSRSTCSPSSSPLPLSTPTPPLEQRVWAATWLLELSLAPTPALLLWVERHLPPPHTTTPRGTAPPQERGHQFRPGSPPLSPLEKFRSFCSALALLLLFLFKHCCFCCTCLIESSPAEPTAFSTSQCTSPSPHWNSNNTRTPNNNNKRNNTQLLCVYPRPLRVIYSSVRTLTPKKTNQHAIRHNKYGSQEEHSRRKAVRYLRRCAFPLLLSHQ